MSTKRLQINSATGGSFSAYLSLPSQGRGPGLIILQEIFGVNHHIRSVADAYAQEGYVVAAPDMFWRIQPDVELNYTGEDLQKAFQLYQQFNVDQAVKDIGDSIKTLLALPECTGGAAIVGYCLGGKLTYLSAARLDSIKAASAYYGGGIDEHLNESSRITCPMLMHFGALDKHITMESVDKIKNACQSKSNVEIFIYENADHGFNCTQRASYNKEAADLAFQRTMAMLKKALPNN